MIHPGSFWRHYPVRKALLLIVAVSNIGFVRAKTFVPKPLMSAIIPGSGEIALGHYTKGIILLTSEAIALNAFITTDKSMSLQQTAYKNYAFKYAGVPLGMPQNHYQYVQDYISSEYFNNFQEMMARNHYLIYYNDPQAFADYMAENTFTGEEQWEWRSSEHWQKYQTLRREHQKTKMNHNLALGVMLLNRAVSVIDTAISGSKARNQSYQVYFTPSAQDGLMLNCGINFH
ncbi:MAG TPA: hypothetical protein PKI59_03235 [Candidatus Cloacimonadota bacterium]|nr:hypothetical protein [Candidatus Cloacimonadota bacterium]